MCPDGGYPPYSDLVSWGGLLGAAAFAPFLLRGAFPVNQDSDESSDEQSWPPPFDPWVFIREIPPLGQEWSKRPAVLPKRTRHSLPFTLVLDLDETLVHCSTSEPEDKKYDTQFPVTTNGVDYMVFVRIRAF